jgi:hypothetical protein
MNGPARLTAWASPFSVRSFTSHLGCTWTKARGIKHVAAGDRPAADETDKLADGMGRYR